LRVEYTLTLEKPEKRIEMPLWRASWAESDPANALVHHYFFAARDNEAALEKVFAWMRTPAQPLPSHTRIIYEYWRSPVSSSYGLPIWRIAWQEDGEKHALLLFEPPEKYRAARRAQIWACQRKETLDQFQTLQRLSEAQSRQAWFDPEDGQAMFRC